MPKYLPSSAYFLFINEGLILNKKFLNVDFEALAHFYDFCGRFSQDLQINENKINNYISDNEHSCIQWDLILGGKILLISNLDDAIQFLKGPFFNYYCYKNILNRGIFGEFEIFYKDVSGYIENTSNNESDKQPTDKSFILLGILLGLLTGIVGNAFATSLLEIGKPTDNAGLNTYWGMMFIATGIVTIILIYILIYALEKSFKIGK